MSNKTILAYSGGLDTSAIIPWLIENYSTEVVAYCCDLGNQPEVEKIRTNAFKYGATDFIFEDLKDEFVNHFAYKALRAGATYQGEYLLGTAIARPLIAERIAAYAKKHGAQYIAHGATGKGNDHIRFEKSWAYLLPEVEILAPWKIWEHKGRADLVSYLESKGFSYPVSSGSDYSIDANLLHISTEGGSLEDITKPYNFDEVLELQGPAAEVTSLNLEFLEGILTKVNNELFSGAAALELLNTIGAKYGIGTLDLVEERFNGIKSRGIYKTPGGSILFFAINQLKQICWNRKQWRIAQQLSDHYGDLIYDGDWHTEARQAVESFFSRASKNLTGSVELKIQHGGLLLAGRKSPFSLYKSSDVSFEEDKHGFYAASSGYSKFVTYPSLMEGKIHRGQIYRDQI